MGIKKRLDSLVHKRLPTYSRTVIQTCIKNGHVTVNDVIVTKPGAPVDPEATIILSEPTQKYVCRAGEKLEAALEHHSFDVKNLVCLDAGLSTGGFTDCLLQLGAKKVYGIDVGHGQVHERIAQDSRVVVMEKTNLRHLESLPEKVDLATLDVSFISLLTVMPAVVRQLRPHAHVMCLIKPQFEAGREHVGRGGLVTSQAVHKAVIKKVVDGCAELGLQLVGAVISSPLIGAASGNTEFLALFEKK